MSPDDIVSVRFICAGEVWLCDELLDLLLHLSLQTKREKTSHDAKKIRVRVHTAYISDQPPNNLGEKSVECGEGSQSPP